MHDVVFIVKNQTLHFSQFVILRISSRILKVLMNNLPTLLSGQFSSVTFAKELRKKSFLAKVISVFVAHNFEKMRTDKNVTLWFFDHKNQILS